MDMSLFFEDEIQKAMRKANDVDMENFLSQDPRRESNKNRRNENPFHQNRNSRQNPYNPYKRARHLWDESDDY